MNEEEIERRVRAAFAARADGAVGDDAPRPAPRFADVPSPSARRHRARWLAPLAAAAAVLVVVAGVLAFDRGTDAGRHPVAGGHSVGGRAGDGSTTSWTPKATTVKPVHIRLFNADGAQYGVGMPVVAIFSRKITDARPLARATTVTVNGRPATVAWYFPPGGSSLGAMEAHLRPATYWPADAKVHLSLETAGLVAGRNLRFDDALTLDFTTGPKTIVSVDDHKHRMTVQSNGKPLGTYRLSLGAAKTPTTSGTKVILRQQPSVCLAGVNHTFKLCNIKYAQQVSFSGEYLIAAPWDVKNIEQGRDTGNGCTDLLPADAATLYRTLRVGDVVSYASDVGPKMTMGEGFADWDVPWSAWLTGGKLRTS